MESHAMSEENRILPNYRTRWRSSSLFRSPFVLFRPVSLESLIEHPQPKVVFTNVLESIKEEDNKPTPIR